MNDRNQTRILICPNCGEVLECSSDAWEKHYEQERREWMDKAHKAFDALWKSGIVERSRAYDWLAEKLKVPRDECHFGNFSLTQLKNAFRLCSLAQCQMTEALFLTELPEDTGVYTPLANRKVVESRFKTTGVDRCTPVI